MRLTLVETVVSAAFDAVCVTVTRIAQTVTPGPTGRQDGGTGLNWGVAALRPIDA